MVLTQQSFYEIYVSPDDEVTTIISRMYHAREKLIVLIIPQRAMILQSIINLRLIDREAKKLQKDLLIVTQDESGAALAERIGLRVEALRTWQKTHHATSSQHTPPQRDHSQNIDVQQPGISQEDIGAEHFTPDELQQGTSSYDDEIAHTTIQHDDLEQEYEERTSQTFGAGAPLHTLRVQQKAVPVSEQQSSPDVSSRPAPRTMDLGRRPSPSQHRDVSREEPRDFSPTKPQPIHTPSPERTYPSTEDSPRVSLPPLFRFFVQRVMPFFRRFRATLSVKGFSSLMMHNRAKRFVVLGLFLIGSVLFFALLPRTVVTIVVDDIREEESLRVTAGEEITTTDVQRRMIPARRIEKDLRRTVVITPTGPAQSEAQKAHGTIHIINTFSSAPQPLVATTRFLAKDGTLFRLVNAITVPGTSHNDTGDLVEGTIDARVVADQPGVAGNIPPTTFSIPGFAGGPKAEKIYATSDEPMTGGSAKEDALKTIRDQDIADAKKIAEEHLDQFVRDEIKKILKPSEKLLADAFTFETVSSQSSATPGDALKDPEYTVTLRARALVFEESALRDIVQSLFAQRSSHDVNTQDINLTYGDSQVSFDEGTLIINAIASRVLNGQIDLGAFRRTIAGMSHEALGEMIKEKYPMIQDVTLRVFPTFPSVISNHLSRVPLMTKIIQEKVSH